MSTAFKRVLFYPFFSQQDKQQSKFRLESDSGVKLYMYMAEKLVELGHDVGFAVPSARQLVEDDWKLPAGVRPCNVGLLPIDNLHRRLHWDAHVLRAITRSYDVVFTQHEFLAYPLKCLKPELKVVMECGIKPDTAWPQTKDLFPLAWKTADAVHCNSEELRRMVLDGGAKRAWVWQFGYDERDFHPNLRVCDRDVLFPARASSTNYSHHKEFVEALKTTLYSVLCTDPTGYLRQTREAPDGWLPLVNLNREAYLGALHSSKVVVGLTDNGYGGYAFREAIAAGCVPVALYTEGYRELLGDDWPYYCRLDNILSAVNDAVYWDWPSEKREDVIERLRKSSYQHAWKTAKEDLKWLL